MKPIRTYWWYKTNITDAGLFQEDGETLETAAIREAKEETGLDVKLFGVVAVNEF